MKRNRSKSFGKKLWLCFIIFAAIIFAALWLLQIVFLQSFYNVMAIRSVKQAASQIVEQRDSGGLTDAIDHLASEHSLLIFLTDRQGNVLYSADEHHSVYENYEKDRDWDAADAGGANPYRNPNEPMSWQIGAFRNLPQNYSDFLARLAVAENGSTGYSTEDNAAYIYGMLLPPSEQFGSGETVLYISMQLGAVGATSRILRIQLIWVTLASLAIGFIIAYFLSRQFAGPVSAISARAKRMAAGEFAGSYEKGFCLELDELSDTLDQTAAALERLENARRELLANVSHDLRTPLTMIKGYAEMVRDISWDDDGKRNEDLAIIIREADRLTGLVNDILEYSAVQSPDLSVEFQAVDLSSAAQSVAAQFAPLCEQSDDRLEVSIEPGQWVIGSENLLQRVFYNLIDNAFTHSGDHRRVQVSLKGDGTVVRAEVRDDGPGIPREKLPYIWDRYFTSKQRSGNRNKSGLGLAITKEILLKQKADFGVECEPGQGCMFWFELKRQPQPEAGPSVSGHQPQPEAAKRTMLF